MEKKHTPGPWHRNVPPATKYPTIFSGINTHVSRVVVDGLSPEEVDANASLIACAPEMLEMLNQLAEELEWHGVSLLKAKEARELIKVATTL
ncbi:MAG TPA: hypothetical protein VD907_06765 [Verrucomicrobiae bacterium]|nr:hypothetical protein [Verrucomicrobiae bacterium]